MWQPDFVALRLTSVYVANVFCSFVARAETVMQLVLNANKGRLTNMLSIMIEI